MMHSRRFVVQGDFPREFYFLFVTSPNTTQGGVEPGTSGTEAGRFTTRPQQLLDSVESLANLYCIYSYQGP